MSSVLEMALEALQGMRDMWASVCISHGWEPNHLSQYDDAGKAIAALKEAIKNEKTCAELLSEQGYEYSRQTNALIKRHAEQMEAIKNQGGMCAKGQAFKEYDKRDSTALESAISQAMREALLEAINEWEKPYGLTDGSPFIERLRRMAKELK